MEPQKEAEDVSVQSTEKDKKNEKQTDSSSPFVPSAKPFSQFVDGFQIPGMFPAECFRSAVSYKPRPDDLILVTYPKCGTTWTQHILLLILRHGEPVESQMQAFVMSPFLEITGAEGAEQMPRPGVIKVHLPYYLTPRSDKAKYICVTRNPKDCCVSYFHHMKNIPGHGFNGTFDEFFEFFISGNIDYGDYFDHLLGWYEHRNDPNVLFITYEEIKENPEKAILKMASFIDEKLYAEPLRDDPQKLQNVVKYSSFDYMKKTVNQGMDDMFKMSKEDIMKSDLPDAMKKMFSNMPPPSQRAEEPKKSNFVRKGIIGDWRNYFSEDQTRRLDEKFKERTKGTDIPILWGKYINDPNVLFITYEEIKENPEKAILRMASFIDEKLYAEPLRDDPQKLQNVVKYSSFDYMKKTVNQGMDDMFKMAKEDIMKSDLPDAMKKMFSNMPPPSQGAEGPKKTTFIRKGIIGDWRNYFSEDQTRRLDEKFAERTKGTDIPNLWSKYM